MTLYVQSLSGGRSQYVINNFSDLEQLESQYPAIREIALFSHSIEEAVDSIAEYLSSHHMDAWVDQKGEISKTVRSALGALGMAAAMAFLPTSTSAGAGNPDMKVLEQKESSQFSPFGSQKEDKFLHNLMQLESAGGKMTNHQTVKHGILRNEKAIGRWGLMPSTVDDVLHRLDKTKRLHNALRPLMSMNRDQRADYFKKKPYAEVEIARHLARHVLARNHNDLSRAAYSWNNGHNLYPHEITDQELTQSPYVKDFSQLAHGQQVRGLKGMAMYRMPAGKKIKKSDENFGSRLKSWKKQREEDARKNPTVNTITAHTQDLGRTRDPELDRQPPRGDYQKLEEAIRQANKKP